MILDKYCRIKYILLTLLLASCSKPRNLGEKETIQIRKEGINLEIKRKDEGKLQFNLVNNTNDTIFTTPVGANRNRYYFLVNGVEHEFHSRVTLFEPITILPGDKHGEILNIERILPLINLDSKTEMDIVWRYRGDSSNVYNWP